MARSAERARRQLGGGPARRRRARLARREAGVEEVRASMSKRARGWRVRSPTSSTSAAQAGRADVATTIRNACRSWRERQKATRQAGKSCAQGLAASSDQTEAGHAAASCHEGIREAGQHMERAEGGCASTTRATRAAKRTQALEQLGQMKEQLQERAAPARSRWRAASATRSR